MPIDLTTTLFPVTVPLYRDGETPHHKDLKDARVTIVPPSWAAERQRDQFIMEKIGSPSSLMQLDEYELYLTFGGATLSFLVPRRDENGALIWSADGTSVEQDVIDFSKPGIDFSSFIKALGSVPYEIIAQWRKRMLEVVPQWKETFRRSFDRDSAADQG